MSSLAAWVSGGLGTLDLRSSYADANLQGLALTDPENLIVPGGRQWRRMIVQGNFQHGGGQVHCVMDLQKIQFTVLIQRATHAGIQSDITSLFNHFSQYTYELHITMDSVHYAWRCWEADIAVNMNRKAIHAKAPEVKFDLIRQPIPIAGPF